MHAHAARTFSAEPRSASPQRGAAGAARSRTPAVHHRFDRIAVDREPPIQAAGLKDRLLRLFGFRDLEGPRRPAEGAGPGEEQPLFERRPYEPMRLEHDEAMAQNLGNTPPSERLQQAALAASAASSVGKHTTYLSTAASVAKGAQVAGSVGGGVAMGSSLLNAGLAAHRVHTGNDHPGDRNLLRAEAGSELGSALTSGAAMGGAIAGALSPAVNIAGGVGAGLITGPIDIARGTVGGLAAHRRMRGLERDRDAAAPDSTARFSADFARDVQKTKRVGHAGTALKGALALGGGIALLAGAGPVGWGLLGAGALVGAGVAGYKAYRKHQAGKKLLDPNGPHAAAVQQFLPTASEMKKNKWFYQTEAQFKHDWVRDRLAAHVKDHRGQHSPELLRLLGLENNAEEREIKQGLSA
ncbi:MAG TPA: hypothetical protein VHT53_01035 [Candidatus Elarobacter sp.]|nr:hypothetical protein [Candidatus Elarobacter sp.]